MAEILFHGSKDILKKPFYGGGKRHNEVVVPRQIVMYLCRDITDTSYKAIGILLGNRDHSTIISGDNKIRQRIKSNDEKLKNTIDIIRKKLDAN